MKEPVVCKSPLSFDVSLEKSKTTTYIFALLLSSWDLKVGCYVCDMIILHSKSTVLEIMHEKIAKGKGDLWQIQLKIAFLAS